MDSDQGGVMGQVGQSKETARVVGISKPITTITATVTKEMERSFTEDELAAEGGVLGAMTTVLAEANKYGTIVDHNVEAKIVK